MKSDREMKLINCIESWRWASFFGFERFTDARQSGDTTGARTLKVQQHKTLVLIQIACIGEFQMVDDLVVWIVAAGCFASRCILVSNVFIQTGKVLLKLKTKQTMKCCSRWGEDGAIIEKEKSPWRCQSNRLPPRRSPGAVCIRQHSLRQCSMYASVWTRPFSPVDFHTPTIDTPSSVSESWCGERTECHNLLESRIHLRRACDRSSWIVDGCGMMSVR